MKIKMMGADLTSTPEDEAAFAKVTTPEQAIAAMEKHAKDCEQRGEIQKAVQLRTWLRVFDPIRSMIHMAAIADNVMMRACEETQDVESITIEIIDQETGKPKLQNVTINYTREQMEACLSNGGSVRGVVRSLMDMITQGLANCTGEGIDQFVLDEFKNSLEMARTAIAAMKSEETGASQKQGVTWH